MGQTESNWVTLKDRTPVQNGTTHVNHSIAWYSRRRRVVDVVYFKDDLASRWHRDTIAVRQRQSLVVVQHRVKVLNPDRVDRTVQN